MKMASWGYCVSVFDSSGVPASRPGDALLSLVFRVGPNANLSLGRRHPAVRYPALYRVLPWVCIKFVTIYFFLFWLRSVRWYVFDISIGVTEAAMISSGGDDIPIEVETRNQSRC